MQGRYSSEVNVHTLLSGTATPDASMIHQALREPWAVDLGVGGQDLQNLSVCRLLLDDLAMRRVHLQEVLTQPTRLLRREPSLTLRGGMAVARHRDGGS